ncbi:unnamed protein product [Strongylus vulgaris]|uniref:Uncharacterized protein n=1 Tax=Strongylus vulgaris TaxID=40348 RepID=A0A3P7IPX4_STRVU|nr:unnamed protein product [Strongylus vulgaris]
MNKALPALLLYLLMFRIATASWSHNCGVCQQSCQASCTVGTCDCVQICAPICNVGQLKVPQFQFGIPQAAQFVTVPQILPAPQIVQAPQCVAACQPNAVTFVEQLLVYNPVEANAKHLVRNVKEDTVAYKFNRFPATPLLLDVPAQVVFPCVAMVLAASIEY